MRSRNRKTPNKQTNHQINQFKNVYQINEKKIPLHQSKSLNFWPFPNTAKHSHETKKKYSTKKLQQTQLKFTLINCKKYHILLDCINFIRTQKKSHNFRIIISAKKAILMALCEIEIEFLANLFYLFATN